MKKIPKIEERNIYDLILIIGFCLILIGGCLVTYLFIISKVNQCTSDPLKYATEKISNEYDFDYEYVLFEIYQNKNDLFPIQKKEIDLSQKINIIK